MDWCAPLGITIHVVGSVGINLGQNMQALGLEQLGAMMHRPCRSKIWIVGMATFIIASLVTFGALSLASASVLVPLESIQFLVNLLFGKFVRKKQITPRMMFGTVVLILGIVMVVIAAPHGTVCFDEQQLIDKWQNSAWIIYFASTFGVAAVMYVVWRKYVSARRQGNVLWKHNMMEPLAFTISSSLFGGGQMIVHSKLLAELLELTAATGEVAFANWFFWLELVLCAVFGCYWFFRLSQCLALCTRLPAHTDALETQRHASRALPAGPPTFARVPPPAPHSLSRSPLNARATRATSALSRPCLRALTSSPSLLAPRSSLLASRSSSSRVAARVFSSPSRADDPLFIIPLMQTGFIIFGAIAGGVFFGEFEDIAHGFAGYGGYVIWAFGIMLNAVGLSFLAPPAEPDAAAAAAAMPPMEDPAQPGVAEQAVAAGSQSAAADGGWVGGRADPANPPKPAGRSLSKRSSMPNAIRMPIARMGGRKRAKPSPYGSSDEASSSSSPRSETWSEKGMEMVYGGLRMLGINPDRGDATANGVRSDVGSPRSQSSPSVEQRRP